MRILFITPGPLGDTVLSTGALRYFLEKYPESRVTIVCGPLGVSLFEGLENCHQIIILKKKAYHLHWLELWKKVRGQRWDIVIDMRDSPLSRVLNAKKRYIKTKNSYRSGDHLVRQNAHVIGLKEQIPAPQIWVSQNQEQQAKMYLGRESKILAVGPTANFPGKMWPSEYYIELLKELIAPGGVFDDYKVAVFGAPDEIEQAQPITKAIGKDNSIDLVGKTDPGTAAACLDHCAFYIGNDSGLTHCAAARGLPVLALFGPSRDENYRPWGSKCDFIRTPESRDELIGYKGFDSSKITKSMMANLKVKDVLQKIQEMKKLQDQVKPNH